MIEEPCACGLDGEWSACIEGLVYGPCEAEGCGGVCEYKGDCEHECHAPAGAQGRHEGSGKA